MKYINYILLHCDWNMSKKFYCDLDLLKNQLKNVVLNEKGNSTVGLSVRELFFVEGDDKNLYTFDGTDIIKIGSFINISEFPITQNLDLKDFKIVNLQGPQDANDAVTLEYLEDYLNDVGAFNLENSFLNYGENTNVIENSLNHLNNILLIDQALYYSIDAPDKLSIAEFTKEITYYAGKLSDGLSSGWYTLDSAGEIIDKYVTSDEFTLNVEFLSGVYSNVNTYGVVTPILDNSESEIDLVVKDLESNNYTSGRIDAFVSVEENIKHSNFWNKTKVSSDLTLKDSGLIRFALKSSKTGTSEVQKFYYDESPGTLSFSSALNVIPDTENFKYLSNVAHYTKNTTLDYTYTAASGIFNKVYHPTQVGKVYLNYNGNVVTNNPSSIPNFDDNFPVSETYEILTDNLSSGLTKGFLYAEIQKPGQVSSVSSFELAYGINTFGDVANNIEEFFQDESYRLELGGEDSWDSENGFDEANDGNDLQVKNGFLIYPDGNDYGNSPTGIKEYNRRFYPNGALSSGYLKFLGIDVENISPYGTGSLNVLIELTDAGKFFDLGKNVGTFDGDSRGTAYAAKEKIYNENILEFSFLNYSIGQESTSSYKLIIIYRDNSPTITYIRHYNNLLDVTRDPENEYGIIGPQGVVGSDGVQGPIGFQGNDANMIGPQGNQGNTGQTGPQGNQGNQGNTGQTGQTGPQGNQGNQGQTGQTGPQGNQGNTGQTGETGETGPQGNQGNQGPLTLQGDDWEYNTRTFYGNGVPCQIDVPELKTSKTLLGAQTILKDEYFVDTEITYTKNSKKNILYYDLDFKWNGNSANHSESLDIGEIFIGIYTYNYTTSSYILDISYKATANSDGILSILARSELGTFSDFANSDNRVRFKIALSTTNDFSLSGSVTPTANLSDFYFKMSVYESDRSTYEGLYNGAGYQSNAYFYINAVSVPGSNPKDTYVDVNTGNVYSKVEDCDAKKLPNGFIGTSNARGYINLQTFAGNQSSVELSSQNGAYSSIPGNKPIADDGIVYNKRVIKKDSFIITNHVSSSQRDLLLYSIPLLDNFEHNTESKYQEVLEEIHVNEIEIYQYLDFVLYSNPQHYTNSTPHEFITEDFERGVFIVDKESYQGNNSKSYDRIDLDSYLTSESLSSSSRNYKKYNLNGTYTDTSIDDLYKVSNVLLRYKTIDLGGGDYDGYWDIIEINKPLEEIDVISDSNIVFNPSQNSNITLNGSPIPEINKMELGTLNSTGLSLNTTSFEIDWDFSKEFLYWSTDEGFVFPSKYYNWTDSSFTEFIISGGWAGTIIREMWKPSTSSWVDVSSDEFDYDTNQIDCANDLYSKIRYRCTDGNSTGNISLNAFAIIINIGCSSDCCWELIASKNNDCCNQLEIHQDCLDILQVDSSEWVNPLTQNEKPLNIQAVPCITAPACFEVPWTFIESVYSTDSTYDNNLELARYGWDKYDNFNFVEITSHVSNVYQIIFKLKTAITIGDCGNDLLYHAVGNGESNKLYVSEDGSTWSDWSDTDERSQYQDCDGKKVRYLKVKDASEFSLYSIHLKAKNCKDNCCYITTRPDILIYHNSYDSDELYYPHDIVYYNDYNYINLTSNVLQDVTPGTGDWSIYSNSNATGIQGEIGPQGNVGETGPQGNQGNVGETGPQGNVGIQGPCCEGNQGNQGTVGPQGGEGEIGPQGPGGSVGTTWQTATATSGSPSAGAIDLSSNSWLYINATNNFNLGIIDTSTIITGFLHVINIKNTTGGSIDVNNNIGGSISNLANPYTLASNAWLRIMMYKGHDGVVHLTGG